MAIGLSYIFVSRFMFATAVPDGGGNDDHYLQFSRPILLALIVHPVARLITASMYYPIAPNTTDAKELFLFLLQFFIAFAGPILIPLALLFTRSQRWHRIGIAFLLLLAIVRII